MPRVLVVDEEAKSVRALAVGLGLEGFDVRTAPTAERALHALAETPADLALVDLMLRGTNGLQVARLIRDAHPETRVVLTSAYPLREQQILRTGCGAVGFVPKPYDVAELATYLHKMIPDGTSSSSS